MEGRGLGMRTLSEAATKHGLPVPKYQFDGLYLNLTIYRHAGAAVRELDHKVLFKLNEDEIAAWQIIVTRELVTTPEMMAQTGFDERKTQRVLKKLQDLKLLERLGKGPATRYKVLRT